ncbi:DNA polymerase beta superfamily protein [Pseudomonas sp. ACN8]
MREHIKVHPGLIEAEHQVRVVDACESGSRGWGFTSPDSD